MASFGSGIERESVFVEKFEALFTKHLAAPGNLLTAKHLAVTGNLLTANNLRLIHFVRLHVIILI